MYRIGWPFWRFLAPFGVPLYLRLNFQQDSEASVIVAVCPDLNGLIVEAETMDEFVEEAQEMAALLLYEYLPSGKFGSPELRLRGSGLSMKR